MATSETSLTTQSPEKQHEGKAKGQLSHGMVICVLTPTAQFTQVQSGVAVVDFRVSTGQLRTMNKNPKAAAYSVVLFDMRVVASNQR